VHRIAHGVSLVLSLSILACARGERLSSLADEELRVLQPAPEARGRHLCRVDSVSTAINGITQLDCDAGGDTTYSVEHDTVVYIERYEVAPDAAPSMQMLDYWKTLLAPEWERRLGGRPDSIAQDFVADFVYFEARWDMPNGTRELVIVSRREPLGGTPSKRVVRRVSLDCRTAEPIGCR